MSDQAFATYTARGKDNVQREVYHAAGCPDVLRALAVSKRNPLAVDPTSFADTDVDSVFEAVDHAFVDVIVEEVEADGGDPDNDEDYRKVAAGYAEYIKVMPCAVAAGFNDKF